MNDDIKTLFLYMQDRFKSHGDELSQVFQALAELRASNKLLRQRIAVLEKDKKGEENNED